MKKWFVIGMMLLSGLAQAAIQEGVDYRVLSKPQPTSSKEVDVIEFFSFNCPHCQHIEPLIEAWKRQSPKGVKIEREQVMWGGQMAGFVKLLSTMKATGTEDRLMQPAFNAVMSRVNLGDPAILAKWITQQKGIDAQKFMATYKSFGVASSVGRAEQMTKSYNVMGTPMVIVAGKYAIEPADPAKVVQVAKELVQKVQAERTGKRK